MYVDQAEVLGKCGFVLKSSEAWLWWAEERPRLFRVGAALVGASVQFPEPVSWASQTLVTSVPGGIASSGLPRTPAHMHTHKENA